MDIKQKIKYILKQQNMSVYSLAAKADLSTACINNWYSKRDYEPSLNALRKICDALNISLAELFYDGDAVIPADDRAREFFNYWSVLNDEQKDNLIKFIKSIVSDIQ